jgi:glycosyltransferase involved in cell wall biosynthesis
MENINIHESMPSTKSPAVSVIVPAYNTEKYIAECLDSLLVQTFQDYEVICIDDGSTDRSLSILKEYAERDPRIKVICKKNQGVVAARNNAIAAASGKYIFPLDSDDIITPNCLEILYKFITTHDYVVVCPSGWYFGKGKEHKPYWNLPKPTRWNMYHLANGIHNSAMYPKKFWGKYGGYDPLFDKGIEDFDFWLNFLDDGQKVIRLPDRLFYYRQKSVEESRNEQMNKHRCKKVHNQLLANLRHKHPKIIKYRLLYKMVNPFHKILRFFFRWETTERGFIIRIFKITVYRNSRAN